MERSSSKASKIGKEVAKHTVWHFTGAPILDSITKNWKQRLGASVPSIGLFIASRLTGINWWWAVVIGLETFALAWFLWNRYVSTQRAAHAHPSGLSNHGLMLKSQEDTSGQPPPASSASSGQQPGRLRIISAHWGIGGDAYKDVTDTVREYAKPDSVNMPVSIGLFGDPYPNIPKKLTVVYSTSKQWTVNVKESDNLTLPEKEGEEQGKKELDRMKARLDALRGGAVDVLLGSGISEAEYNLYVKLKEHFTSLRWCEKVALRSLGGHLKTGHTGSLQNRP